MKISGAPNAQALLHLADRAQEVRKQPLPRQTAPVESGNNLPATGENLPATPVGHRVNHEHATGLARAIENLQKNSLKSPEAQGLQQALTALQARLHPLAIDVEA